MNLVINVECKEKRLLEKDELYSFLLTPPVMYVKSEPLFTITNV